jgi:3-deoxy-alpha-D-manno-octulosonate 8-oxidase
MGIKDEKFRNTKMVSKILFGRGCFDHLDLILEEERNDVDSFMGFLVDDVFSESDLRDRVPVKAQDLLLWVNVDNEPKTVYVDELTDKVRVFTDKLPAGIIGIGGGSTMDLAKAVSLMITNSGSSSEYQGWDLIRNPAVYHVGIPTLSGTGAEVSRTTVLTGPEKKLGINSDYTVFDQIILDPDLISGVPKEQWFYTGMDCYIHCVESLCGTYIDSFGRSYGEKAIDLCREVFLKGGLDSDVKLMLASYFGGLSIACSQVGVCHALSYGLSFVLGTHHGIGNCSTFDLLEEFYPEGVKEFRQMMKRNGIMLQGRLAQSVDSDQMEKMIDVALGLEPLWENALGTDWKEVMTRERIRGIYERLLE